MIIYDRPANAVVLTPTGDGSSAQALMQWGLNGSLPDAVHTGLIPTEVSSATEKSKNGSRRTMIKVATTMPKSVVASFADFNSIGRPVLPGKDLRLQTHLVCECDEDLIRQTTALACAAGEGALDTIGVGQILAMQLRAIAAIVEGDKSVASATNLLPSNGTLVRGLLGLEPLDVVNGTYGKTTAGA